MPDLKELYLTRHDDGRYSVQLGAGPLSVATTLEQALRVYSNARASRYTYTAGERRHLDSLTPWIWVAATGEWEPPKRATLIVENSAAGT